MTFTHSSSSPSRVGARNPRAPGAPDRKGIEITTIQERPLDRPPETPPLDTRAQARPLEPRPRARFGGARARRGWLLAGRAILVGGVAVGGLWTATHGVAGVTWVQVGTVLAGVALGQLGLLAVVWLAGLGVYALVLSAALPGLGVRRSLLLNLSGSAVANVLPFGGAVGTAMNWRMVRGWGHSDAAFAAYCLLTNVLDVLAKLLLPLVAVAVLATLSLHVPLLLWAMTAACAGALLLGLLARWAFGHLRWAGAGPTGRRLAALVAGARESATRMRALLAAGWQRMLPASIGYVAAQVLLLYLALHAVGLAAPVTVVLTAAAVERVLTLVPLTPGGTGVAEAGTIAWLVAAGLDPVQAVAGVLLYRLFLVVMEVPVGGALLCGWALARRLRALSGGVAA